MKIEDLKKKYKGEWLAIKVTERDEYGRPIDGDLVARAKTHHELHLVLKDENVCEVYAGKVPTKAVLFWLFLKHFAVNFDPKQGLLEMQDP